MTVSYTQVVDRLIEASSRAVLGLCGFRSEPLRTHLAEMLGQAPGTEQALLADPVFEAAFGWEPAAVSLRELSGRLLHADVVRALTQPVLRDMVEDFTFPADRAPYLHQLEAWKALADPSLCRSVLVTSGTGSGKTECFLVPILNDAANELTNRHDSVPEGVRAIFLYPLNALIKSQRERLRAWSEPFAGRVRFCLYNGDTPDSAATNWKCEVPDRQGLRNSPPQILVTNPTMLEYMLVRAADAPILQKSQGMLRWIVIDEAHTYLGSQAAELTLLLRRTLHAFGCAPGSVHVVATSATIGDGSDASNAKLKRFLADLAGVGEEQVSVVVGRRASPPPAELSAVEPLPVAAIHAWCALQADDLSARLLAEPAVLALRDVLARRAMSLTQLSEKVFARNDAEARRATLALLDCCTQVRDRAGQPFLPLRGHVFQRTLTGLWVCSNSCCSERQGTALDDPSWPFGAVYFERREHCRCGAPVFDLVQCASCGAEYLSAEEVADEGIDRLRQVLSSVDADAFQENLDPDYANPLDEPVAVAVNQRRRLITSARQAMSLEIGLRPDGSMDWSAEEGVHVHVRHPEENGLRCAVCGDQDTGRVDIEQFRSVRVGAPFMLTVTTPILLAMQPPLSTVNEPRPMGGRRLVSFTDSRQGTARTVARAQQQVERDAVGSLLVHTLAANRPPPAPAADIDEIQKRIAALKRVVGTTPDLCSLLSELERDLEESLHPSLRPLSWDDACGSLLGSDDFNRWMQPDLEALSYQQVTGRSVANLCLFREFYLRPRRQLSLEGMGLVQLVYPALEGVAAPAVLQQRGVQSADWVSLLRLTLDTFVRSGRPAVMIPEPEQRWLGYPGRSSVLLGPGEVRHHPTQRVWPSARSPFAPRNRLIRLLCQALDLRLDRPADADLIDEVLGAMWQALCDSKVLTPVELGYKLILKDSAVIARVTEAWLCPVTRRLLPVSFLGCTPYLPAVPIDAGLATCRAVTMPTLPYPFWQGAPAGAAEQWLREDQAVLTLRKLGVWGDVSDRLARYSRYFRAVEHSAQLSGQELTYREQQFKDGKINLLSCSTTMEMGVDIGGLSTVVMNNVPPHPANFLQRAGRAGRRGETAALSFTLCKSTPHGEAVFRNPLWPFSARVATPRVDLRSQAIVQRHVNALALSRFLLALSSENVLQLNCGWFFDVIDEHTSPPCDRFMEWCQTPTAWPPSLRAGVVALVAGSCLEGVAPEDLLAATAGMMGHTANAWRRDVDSLRGQLAVLSTPGMNSAPEQGIQIRIKRWRGEYLLGQLAGAAVLPGYGFPTGIVPLVTTTAEAVIQQQILGDNQQRRAGFPARGLAIAIRDYAPGTDTVVNGRVYRSSGVTLNWQVPVEAQAAPEIQDLRWLWRCRRCGNHGLRVARPESCPDCAANGAMLRRSRVLLPSGFLVDFHSKPHNDISRPTYTPVRDPLIAISDVPWMTLRGTRLGRYRNSASGELLRRGDGRHGQGFSLCLRCGRADSMTQKGERPASMQHHRRIQGYAQFAESGNAKQICTGNQSGWAIVDGIRLAARQVTEVFELQLCNVAGVPLNDGTVAYTLAVALRRALCGSVGIEEAEVGACTVKAIDGNGMPVHSICLYDTASGGAGYSGQVIGDLPALLRRVHDEFLHCPADCDAACQACLLTYETQHNLDQLNRHAALEFLSDAWLTALDLPPRLRVFGDQTHFEPEPLPLAVEREWQRWPFIDIRVTLGGAVAQWEPLRWRLRDRLCRLQSRGVTVTLILPADCLAALEDSQRDELHLLALETQARLLVVPSGDGHVGADDEPSLIVELGSVDAALRWAAVGSAALVPGADWGSGVGGSFFVRSPRSARALGDVPGARAIEATALRPVATPGVSEFSVRREFDGPARDFGKHAWRLIAGQVPALGTLLQGSTPLKAVSYGDRYLRSPLALLLTERLISALRDFPGGLCDETSVRICTLGLGAAHQRHPDYWTHDWQDRSDRDAVASKILSQFSDAKWAVVEQAHGLPHARLLTLRWADGQAWQLRLDQGVGYWKESAQRPTRFPFGALPEQQAESVRHGRISVVPTNPAHPTFWYAVQL